MYRFEETPFGCAQQTFAADELGVVFPNTVRCALKVVTIEVAPIASKLPLMHTAITRRTIAARLSWCRDMRLSE
jgi:hypothetical protein